MKSKNFGTLIGSFGKGISGSVTINFGVSGGSNCADTCPLKKEGCYAVNAQKRKPSIVKNLERKQADLSGYLSELTTDKALNYLKSAPWVRGSAFGSIPDPENISLDDKQKFKVIAENVDHSKMHFPVETEAKARFLLDTGFNPRLSAADDLTKAETLIIKGFQVSAVVAGEKRAVGKNKRIHSKKAFDVAAAMRAKGISTKVCPAISGSAHCGDCTLCARKDVDLIIYPMH